MAVAVKGKCGLGHDRRGFALVLVAMLAGLVLVVGTALVAVLQLKSAASQYDQSMRLAQDNARAALEVAVAELQRATGPDTVATFASDTLRDLTTDDFNAPSGAVADLQPFWTGVRSSSGTSDEWLVTKPLAADAAKPHPENPITDSVTVVGPGSAGSGAGGDDHLYISVPKEAIVVSELSGYSLARTVGHYAYWVGDMGTKTSYALYDPLDLNEEIRYEIYGDADRGARERLWQMRLSDPDFTSAAIAKKYDDEVGEFVVNETNVLRIDRFLNDFQLREGGGSGSDTMFEELSSDEVRAHFHDFSGLTKGILVDHETGGLREDLSALGSFEGIGLDYRAYANLPYIAESAVALPSGNIAYRLAAKKQDTSESATPAIGPVLTQMNINFSAYLEDRNPDPDVTENVIRISCNAAFELWNPHTVRLLAEAIEIKVKGLGELSVWADSGEVSFAGEPGRRISLDLPVEGKEPRFVLPASVNGQSHWRPGQVVVFSGPENPTTAPFELSFGPDYAGTTSERIVTEFDTPVYSNDEIRLNLRFTDPADESAPYESQEISPVVELRRENGDLLGAYSLDGVDRFNLTVPPTMVSPFEEGVPHFGFSWRIVDSALMSQSVAYHPLDAELDSSAYSYEANSGAGQNVALGDFFQDASQDLIGFNASDFPDVEGTLTVDVFRDLPVLELPRQPVVSIAHLAYASAESPFASPMGSPGSPSNELFDSAFFSSIPVAREPVEEDEGGSPVWSVSDLLPLSFYRVVGDPLITELRSSDAAKHLHVHGQFNVHSTSVSAWAALLKSNDSRESTVWSEQLADKAYLFFNHPQTAEETGFFEMPPMESYEPDPYPGLYRDILRTSVVALTEDEVHSLAGEVVSHVRKRYQGIEPYGAGNQGHFRSLSDFVDSGVLQNAIDDLNAAYGGLINPVPAGAEEGEYPKRFTQRTILNLIAPYISVRSDTFLVRAYGDAVNPAAEDEIWARAYCEAIVQRVHEMHDKPEYGRQFKMIAFRWLNPSEI